MRRGGGQGSSADPRRDRAALERQLRAERKAREALLERQREVDEAFAESSELYDGAPIPLLTLDSGGAIHAANAAATELLGSPGRIVGVRLQKFVQTPQHREALSEHLRRCNRAHEVVTTELQITPPERPPVTVQLRTRRRPGTRRHFPTALVELGAFTVPEAERAQLAEAARSARDASDAKDLFIAMLSHELRTPLTPVLLAISSLMEREDFPERWRPVCEMIRRNVVIEARLLDDLLDATRIARGKMRLEREPTNVHEAVLSCVDVIGEEAAARHLTVRVSLEAQAAWSRGDPVRLRQVFWNLLRNAVKFTAPGGHIDVRSWDKRGTLVVEVSDDGAGFAPETAPRLFRAFEQDRDATTRSGGLGLGLAICKGLVDLHGGSIQGASRGPGQGARFAVELPSIPAPQARVAPPAPAAVHMEAPVRRRVLLVEDHTDTANALADLLGDAGFEVRVATDVRSALATDLAEVDVIVSDIGLPDASGLELMRQVLARRPVRGIALSGFGTEADVRASRAAGFSSHLTKPVEPDALLSALEAIGCGRRMAR